eukprot:TRINITY_DN3749_c0_g1_i1.p1 TRINITY_DN3749_c0_g1~~TRINITY_DN3749_c0_g1_i1.p1  ORF type:complete len:439 (-),score=119.46 TRINITY_DN3749_c0_g1_i1:147-1376(-)
MNPKAILVLAVIIIPAYSVRLAESEVDQAAAEVQLAATLKVHLTESQKQSLRAAVEGLEVDFDVDSLVLESHGRNEFANSKCHIEGCSLFFDGCNTCLCDTAGLVACSTLTCSRLLSEQCVDGPRGGKLQLPDSAEKASLQQQQGELQKQQQQGRPKQQQQKEQSQQKPQQQPLTASQTVKQLPMFQPLEQRQQQQGQQQKQLQQQQKQQESSTGTQKSKEFAPIDLEKVMRDDNLKAALLVGKGKYDISAAEFFRLSGDDSSGGSSESLTNTEQNKIDRVGQILTMNDNQRYEEEQSEPLDAESPESGSLNASDGNPNEQRVDEMADKALVEADKAMRFADLVIERAQKLGESPKQISPPALGAGSGFPAAKPVSLLSKEDAQIAEAEDKLADMMLTWPESSEASTQG